MVIFIGADEVRNNNDDEDRDREVPFVKSIRAGEVADDRANIEGRVREVGDEDGEVIDEPGAASISDAMKISGERMMERRRKVTGVAYLRRLTPENVEIES